jgi:glycosyltransferase involved in cell wall biosynthesis
MRGLEQIAGHRLLFLNWRDLANPQAGGAEAYTEEIASRLAAAGAEVTLFTGKYPGAAPFDWAREYLVARDGGRYGVYLAAARYLRKHGRYYDAVVDCANGIPFFAPLFAPAGTVVVCVVHHVHQSQFDMYFRWPMNRVGRLLEGKVSARVYQRTPFVAVSPSTRAEMRRQLGITAPIHIVPNGVRAMPPSTMARSPTPEIAVVTRLVPHKRLHLLVAAMPALLQRWPDLRVYIAGDGPARAGLRAEARRLGLERHLSLPGRVPDQVKADLLSRAWLTVAPSLAEGWGLTVMEANSLGTPAVAYDVPGLRDSVRDGRTGWLVPADRDLAIPLDNALAELSDPARREAIAAAAMRWAGRFNWDATAERMAGVLLSEIGRARLRTGTRRQFSDLSTVAWWPPEDADTVAEPVRQGLRVTDVLRRDEDGIRVLFTGCDEMTAARALERVPVPPAKLYLASTVQVLCASGEGGLE